MCKLSRNTSQVIKTYFKSECLTLTHESITRCNCSSSALQIASFIQEINYVQKVPRHCKRLLITFYPSNHHDLRTMTPWFHQCHTCSQIVILSCVTLYHVIINIKQCNHKQQPHHHLFKHSRARTSDMCKCRFYGELDHFLQ